MNEKSHSSPGRVGGGGDSWRVKLLLARSRKIKVGWLAIILLLALTVQKFMVSLHRLHGANTSSPSIDMEYQWNFIVMGTDTRPANLRGVRVY